MDKVMKIAGVILIVMLMVMILFVIWLLSVVDYELLSNAKLYKIAKDQGSLIGALLAIIGVYFMIKNQNKTTEETIVNNKIMKEKEFLEIRKQKNIDCFSKIYCEISKELYPSSGSNSLGLMIFEKAINTDHMKDIRVELKYLDLHMMDSEGYLFVMVLRIYIEACECFSEGNMRKFVNLVDRLNYLSFISNDKWKDRIVADVRFNEDTGENVMHDDEVSFIVLYREYLIDCILPTLELHIKEVN